MPAGPARRAGNYLFYIVLSAARRADNL